MPVLQWYRRLSLLARFTVTGMALTVLAGGLVAGLIGRSMERSALDYEAWSVSEIVSQTLGPSVSVSDFEPGEHPERLEELERAERSLAGHSRIRDVRIWGADGTLVYARDHEMVGHRYHLPDGLRQALQGGTTSAPVLVSGIMPEQLEQGLQTYAPIRTMDGAVLGAYEIQHTTHAAMERIEASLYTLWIAVTAGLSILYIGLFGIVKRASRELEWHHRELAQLHSRREIDRMKTEFASTVSHELRAPLTSLIGYSELLLTRGALTGQPQEWAELINRQSNRLSDLLDDILSASMIEDNAVQVTSRELDVPAVVARSLSLMPATASGVVIESDLPPSLPPILADRERVTQILTNLLSNAVKYSPDGGEVRVTASVMNGRLRLSVIDRGLGIAQAELPRLFERFHRVHARSHPQIHGTGLGLYISRGLAELQGGALWAESAGPGLGTTFHLELPLAPLEQAPAGVVRPALALRGN